MEYERWKKSRGETKTRIQRTRNRFEFHGINFPPAQRLSPEYQVLKIQVTNWKKMNQVSHSPSCWKVEEMHGLSSSALEDQAVSRLEGFMAA